MLKTNLIMLRNIHGFSQEEIAEKIDIPVGLMQKDATTFIQALVIAFLISPYGLPKIALWVTAYIEFARDRLKEI